MSSFFFIVGQWFFAYQYLHSALILPKLFNVAKFKNLHTPILQSLDSLETDEDEAEIILMTTGDNDSQSKIK